jgi:exopolyphosphatase/guanosine-5'-triphosphate,3'-diphosphate pyrophosphatase
MPDATVAAVDCGTNSTRLLVAGADGATLDRRMRVTRLGQGVDATGKLDPEAIARTLSVLADYRAAMDSHGVGAARMAATSAVRDAVNGAEFLEAAAGVVGVAAELLSGDEEGRLAFAGATADLAPVAGHDVVVDIGGGSTELVVGRGAQVEAVSIDMGCVRLTERYLAHDPPTEAELDATARAVEEGLALATETVPTLGRLAAGSRLIGLAGTVSTLASLEQGLVEYDAERIHHFVLSRPAVVGWRQRLASETSAARGRRPGMDPGRQDVIVAGVLVLELVMVHLGFDECLVSERDILDGLVASVRGEAGGTLSP